MFQLNERFKVDRDQYCWHLLEVKKGTSKKGEPIETHYVTYYAKLAQLLEEAWDRSLGDVRTIEELQRMVYANQTELVAAAKQINLN